MRKTEAPGTPKYDVTGDVPSLGKFDAGPSRPKERADPCGRGDKGGKLESPGWKSNDSRYW